MVNLLPRGWHLSDIQCFPLSFWHQDSGVLVKGSDHTVMLFQPEDAEGVPARGFVTYPTRWSCHNLLQQGLSVITMANREQ